MGRATHAMLPFRLSAGFFVCASSASSRSSSYTTSARWLLASWLLMVVVVHIHKPHALPWNNSGGIVDADD